MNELDKLLAETNDPILKDAVDTLRWVIIRVETEYEQSRSNWERASKESLEECYGALGRIEAMLETKKYKDK